MSHSSPLTGDWHYVIYEGHQLPTMGTTGDNELSGYNGASCSSKTCAAAGSYVYTDNNTYPLLSINVNTPSSTTWHTNVNYNTPALPNYNTDAVFNSVSCSTNGSTTSCVAVGSYLANNSNSQYPLLYVTSTDTGSGGSYVIDAGNTLPLSIVPNTMNNEFLSVACTIDGETCFVAGEYTVAGVTTPVILKGVYPFTNNSMGNEDWSIVALTLPSIQVSADNVSQFVSVTCNLGNGNHDLCFAAGKYFDENANEWPLLYSGSVNGVWSGPKVYYTSPTSNNFPPNAFPPGTIVDPSIIGEFLSTETTPTFRKPKLTPAQQVNEMAREASNTLEYTLPFLS
jgi:hypothetical protein